MNKRVQGILRDYKDGFITEKEAVYLLGNESINLTLKEQWIYMPLNELIFKAVSIAFMLTIMFLLIVEYVG